MNFEGNTDKLLDLIKKNRDFHEKKLEKEISVLEDIVSTLLNVHCEHCEREVAASLKELYQEKYNGRELLDELGF